jgi:hypothetical protein
MEQFWLFLAGNEFPDYTQLITLLLVLIDALRHGSTLYFAFY